jgi:hypothetical protein
VDLVGTTPVESPASHRRSVIRVIEWLLLALAVVQFVSAALPPGYADLISVQSLALDLSQGTVSYLYPGRDFLNNDAWIAHHTRNLARLGASGEPNWCFYPPLIPALVAPLSSASPDAWRLVWAGVQIVLIFGFVALVERLLVVTNSALRPRRVLLYALVIGSYPVAASVDLGQTSLLIAAIVWAGVYFGLQDRNLRRAVFIGVAAFVKPFILLAEAPQIARRKSFSLIAALVVVAGLFALSLARVGVPAHVEYWNFLRTLGASQTAFSGNQSLLAGVLRLFSGLPVTDYGFAQIPRLALLGNVLAVLILVVAATAQWRARDSHPLAATGLWLSAATLALPISWEHHLILLLPAVAYLWTRRWSRSGWLLLGLATMLLEVKWAFLYGDRGLGRLWASLPLFGNVILFGLTMSVHFREGRAAPKEQKG